MLKHWLGIAVTAIIGALAMWNRKLAGTVKRQEEIIDEQEAEALQAEQRIESTAQLQTIEQERVKADENINVVERVDLGGTFRVCEDGNSERVCDASVSTVSTPRDRSDLGGRIN